MNFKLTFSLVIVLLIASIIFFWIPKGPTATTQPNGTTPLFASHPAIKSMTYVQDGAIQVRFDKQGDKWRMTQPIDAAVDAFTLSPITSSIEGMTYLRKFQPEDSGDKSAQATGTDKPHNVVKFTDENNKEHSLNFGKRSNDGYYATLDSDKTIYVLPSSPIDSLDKDPDAFRDKVVTTVPDTSKITRLEIKTKDSDVTLSKSGDKWNISSPISARANQANADAIAKSFGDVRALAFSTLDKNLTQLKNPAVTVSAWYPDPNAPAAATQPATVSPSATQTQPALKETTLQFGIFSNPIDLATSPVYASVAGDNDVFTFSRDAFNKLNKPLQDLRDPAITPAPVRAATAFDITTDGAPSLSASRTGDDWTLHAAGANLPGDPAAIADYLGQIADERAIKYVDNAGDLKSIGLDPPHMKIEITIPDQAQHEVFLVGKPETADKVTPVMRQGEPTVYLLQTASADQLATTKLALRDRNVETLTADHIRKIEITGADATTGIAPSTQPATAPATTPAPTPGLTLERDGSHWTLQKNGAAQPSDDSKVTALLADFTPLVSVKYLDDKSVDASTANLTALITVLEPTIPPATAPATATASSQPPTAPALPKPDFVGPDKGKLVTYRLNLYKTQSGNTTTWKAVWDHQSPAWTFQPTPALIEHLTTETYTPAPTTSTAPAPPTNP